jgi:hypothetical protein
MRLIIASLVVRYDMTLDSSVDPAGYEYGLRIDLRGKLTCF